jgi:hypothetical protein
MTEISCPTCGAKSNSIVANCEYCGVEIANAQNLKPEEYISAMGRAMVKARENAGWFSGNKDEAEIAALKAFPIPTEIQTLTAFFMFCHGNQKRRGHMTCSGWLA